MTTPSAATPSTASGQVHDPAPAQAGAPGGRRGTLGPVGLVLAGGISVQFGGALAVTLMSRVGALGVVTIRLLVAAVVLMVLCRRGCAGTPAPTGAR